MLSCILTTVKVEVDMRNGMWIGTAEMGRRNIFYSKKCPLRRFRHYVAENIEYEIESNKMEGKWLQQRHPYLIKYEIFNKFYEYVIVI